MNPDPWRFAKPDREIAREAAILAYGTTVLIPRPVRWFIVLLGWFAAGVLLALLLPGGWSFGAYALCGAPLGYVAAMIGMAWQEAPRWHRDGSLS